MHHSTQGQTLCLVNWEPQSPGLKLFCIQHGCDSRLKRERTNFSKNPRLFPVGDLVGASDLCTVAGHKCAKCKCTCNANKAALLHTIPESMRNECPCNPKHLGFGSTFGFTGATSDLMEDLLLMHRNGDVMAKLLKKAMDNDCMDQLWLCLSHWSLTS